MFSSTGQTQSSDIVIEVGGGRAAAGVALVKNSIRFLPRRRVYVYVNE